MRLGKYLTSLTMLELEQTRDLLNLSDDELIVFNELSKGRSNLMVADKCGVSTSTVSNRIKAIVRKIDKINKIRRGEYK